MFSKSGQYYDLIYSFKDYTSEAEAISALIEKEVPGATRILDVACGTHEHVRTLKDHFHVDGVDVQADLLDIARAKNPDGRYLLGDMRDFDMGETYDVVTCLFSSIGYMLTLDDLRKAIANLARHLKPGGLLVIEPWLTPEAYRPGTAGMRTAETDEIKIARINSTRVEGRLAVMDFHYLVAEGTDVSHFVEEHRTRLCSQDEMEDAFRACGQPVRHIGDWIARRGLYINR